MASFDITKLKNYGLSKVTLALPQEAIQGFTVNDFDISGSNQFSTFFSIRALDSIANTSRVASEIISIGFGTTPFKIEHFGLSKFSWQSSSRFRCTLNLLFVEVDESDNTIAAVRSLLTTVFPTVGGRIGEVADRTSVVGGIASTIVNRASSIANDFVVTPPLGFGWKGGGPFNELPKSGIAITIGNWFSTNPLFVIENIALKLSKVPIPEGRPQWMTASISLVSARMNTLSEVQSWFRDGIATEI